jgi:hypothetical protein
MCVYGKRGHLHCTLVTKLTKQESHLWKIKSILDTSKSTRKHHITKTYLELTELLLQILKRTVSRVAPLHKLLNQGVRWHWEPEQQQCFDKTKMF